MISKTLSWTQENSIPRLLNAFSQNYLVVGTSDTVAGFLAPLNQTGFNALNMIKGRQEKPYLILIGNVSAVAALAENYSLQVEKLVSCWPGPLTLILRAKKAVPDYMKSKEGTIALRMPNHAGLLALLQELPGLFSTSANKAGQPVPTSIDAIDPDILNNLDLVVNDGEQGGPISTVPSTILDCTGDVVKLVREGAYSLERLEKETGIAIQK